MTSRIHESIDTNIILRLILRDVPEQCLKIQDLIMRQGYIYEVPDLAITEAVYVLQRSYTRPEIVDRLQKIFELPNFQVNQSLFNQIFPLYLQHSKLSFNDCYLAVSASLNQSALLWTFDRSLAKLTPTAKLLK